VRKRRKTGSAFNETSVAELLMDEKIYSAGIVHSYSTTTLSNLANQHLQQRQQQEKEDDGVDFEGEYYDDYDDDDLSSDVSNTNHHQHRPPHVNTSNTIKMNNDKNDENENGENGGINVLNDDIDLSPHGIGGHNVGYFDKSNNHHPRHKHIDDDDDDDGHSGRVNDMVQQRNQHQNITVTFKNFNSDSLSIDNNGSNMQLRVPPIVDPIATGRGRSLSESVTGSMSSSSSGDQVDMNGNVLKKKKAASKVSFYSADNLQALSTPSPRDDQNNQVGAPVASSSSSSLAGVLATPRKDFTSGIGPNGSVSVVNKNTSKDASSNMTRSLSLPSWKSFTDINEAQETRMVSHHYKAKRRQRVSDPVEKARQENQDFMDTNKRTENELGRYLLSQLHEGESLYWADVPLYSYKHSKTLRNALIFITMSMCLSLLFGVISAFIAPLNQALVISSMGVFACVIPLAAGVYYTISLRGLNIMYCMTTERIIFCKRKGFLRNQYVHVSYRYGDIDVNNIIHKEYLPEVSQRGKTYGNLFFAKDDSSNSSDEWKLDPNSTHNRIGFRAILSVDEVEEILLLKVELKHRELMEAAEQMNTPESETADMGSVLGDQEIRAMQ